jgi:hypothetical protein
VERLYGGSLWQRAYTANIAYSARETHLAALYRQSFSVSQHGVYHPLRSSDGQVRHFIHMAKSPTAAKAFFADYQATLKYGLFAGTALNEAQKAGYAGQLFAAFQGTTVSINDMYAAQVTALDKGQLRAVMGCAERGGYGNWSAITGVMSWSLVRMVRPELLFDFGE